MRKATFSGGWHRLDADGANKQAEAAIRGDGKKQAKNADVDDHLVMIAGYRI
jgi:hypothetical protein